MNNKWIILILTVLFVLGFIIGCQWQENRSEPLEITDTITQIEFKWHTDSFTDTIVKPKYIKVLKRDTVFKENGDTMELVRTQNTYQKSFVSDKDTAEVEIYISGVETSLDSLEMRLKTHTEIRTVEVTKYIDKKRKLFELKPQITTGYDPFRNEFGVLVGVGIGINL